MKNETIELLKNDAMKAANAAQGGGYALALELAGGYLKARTAAVRAGENVRRVAGLTRAVLKLASELADRARWGAVQDLAGDVAEIVRELND